MLYSVRQLIRDTRVMLCLNAHEHPLFEAHDLVTLTVDQLIAAQIETAAMPPCMSRQPSMCPSPASATGISHCPSASMMMSSGASLTNSDLGILEFRSYLLFGSLGV